MFTIFFKHGGNCYASNSLMPQIKVYLGFNLFKYICEKRNHYKDNYQQKKVEYFS